MIFINYRFDNLSQITADLSDYPKLKIYYFSVDSSNAIPADSYKDYTFDITELGFDKTPVLIGIAFPWVSSWTIQSISTSSITVRLYNGHTGTAHTTAIKDAYLVFADNYKEYNK